MADQEGGIVAKDEPGPAEPPGKTQSGGNIMIWVALIAALVALLGLGGFLLALKYNNRVRGMFGLPLIERERPK